MKDSGKKALFVLGKAFVLEASLLINVVDSAINTVADVIPDAVTEYNKKFKDESTDTSTSTEK